VKLWLKYFLLGGFSCWGPQILVAAPSSTLPHHFGSISWVLPLSACVVYFLLLRSERRGEMDPSIAGSMLSGIWVMAPLLLQIEEIFRQGWSRTSVAGLWNNFEPVYVFTMTARDRTLAGALFVTAFLLVEHWRNESGHWVLPRHRSQHHSIS
jgi:hypothetical protein